MAKRSSQTFQKYQKEQVRRQKQTYKAARRFQAKQRQAQAATGDRASEPPSARP